MRREKAKRKVVVWVVMRCVAVVCSLFFFVSQLLAQDESLTPPEVIVIGYGSSRYQTSFSNSENVVTESYKVHSLYQNNLSVSFGDENSGGSLTLQISEGSLSGEVTAYSRQLEFLNRQVFFRRAVASFDNLYIFRRKVPGEEYLVRADMEGEATAFASSDGQLDLTFLMQTDLPKTKTEKGCWNGCTKKFEKSYVVSSSTLPWFLGGCITVPEFPGERYCSIYDGAALVNTQLQNTWRRVSSIADSGSIDARARFTVTVAPKGGTEPKPGDPEEVPNECHGEGINQSLSSGNVSTRIPDPIRTRGYPLINNIWLNTQGVEKDRALSNATFTYDIHITEEEQGGANGIHRILVDGDGSRYDYGDIRLSPHPEAGAFGTLVETDFGYELHGAGRPEDIREAGNFTYYFDKDGRLVAVVDPQGNRQILSYIGEKLNAVTDVSSNKHVTFSYNGSRVVEINENNGGAITRLSYDEKDLLSRVETISEDGTLAQTHSFTYDAYGTLSSVVTDDDEKSTRTFTHEYVRSSRFGELVARSQVTKDNATSVVNYKLQPAAGFVRRTSKTNAKGGVTYFDFDSAGNVGQITLPTHGGSTAPTVYTFTYNSDRKVTSVSDGKVTTSFAYNEKGLPLSVTEGDGGTKTFAYSGVNLESIADERGLVVSYSYEDENQPNLPTTVTNGAGEVFSYRYNPYGQLLSVTPPEGGFLGTLSYTYDEDTESPSFGYLRSVTDGSGRTSFFDTYSKLGDVTSYRTHEGAVSQSREYDALHRMTRHTFGDGTTVTKRYSGSALLETTDELGTTYAYSFCKACGGLEAVSGPLGWSLSFGRDGDSDVTEFVDALKNKTTYGYGKAEELLSTTYPDSAKTSYLYDVSGRVRAEVNARGQETSYSYDGAGRTSSVTRLEGVTTYTYEPDGLVSEVKDVSGSKTYTYDLARRVKSITYDYTASGLLALQTLELTYSPDGLLSLLTWKSSEVILGSWEYQYDGAGRITSVKNLHGEEVRFKYDASGKLVSEQHSNGVTTSYTFDEVREWITRIIHQTPEETFSLEMTRDRTGKVVSILSGEKSTHFAYDELYRLVREAEGDTTTSFEYDLSGNLVKKDGSEFGTYDIANKLLTLNGTAVTHDVDGNITTAGGETFFWNSQGKLLERTKDGVPTFYRYSDNGYRVVREREGQKTFFIYLGNLLLGEVTEDGSIKRSYTWSPSGITSLREGGESFTLLSGSRGEVLGATNSSGAIVSRTSYTAYGEIKEVSGKSLPLTFSGKFGCYTEDELILCGQRWYAPKLTRWLSRDPIGYEGGVNLYGFVEQDPINYVDPSGAIPVDTIWDFGNVLYDIWNEDEEALALDLAAMLVPYLPAGITKIDDVAEACAKAKKFGRGRNKLKPDPLAQGPHSTFRRNKDGNINHYEEFSPNPQNPRGFDAKKRYDGEGAPHRNKRTKESIPTPHIQGRDITGGVRAASPSEIPDRIK